MEKLQEIRKSDFYFDLPPELIAQTPLERRDGSRLLALDKATGETRHLHFYDLPSLPEIRRYCLEQVDTLWDEVKRFDNPHKYYVDLSQKLWDVKHGLLEKNG